MDMEGTLVDRNRFSLRGHCPFCGNASAFVCVTDPLDINGDLWSALRCQGCLRLILGAVRGPNSRVPGEYVVHYPESVPDEGITKEIPTEIAADLKEGLRCRWIKANKAAVVMCRRALQAACLDLGAKGRNLDDQIDSLTGQGRITLALQGAAHAIRLGGNRGAHPGHPGKVATPTGEPAVVEPADRDDLQGLTSTEADAVIMFTKEFLHHVYVVPTRLAEFREKLEKERRL